MPSAVEDKDHSIVIIGAGIIGCATAYYLSRTQNGNASDQIHLIESSTELFSSASGKSGGFLTEDWFGPSTASLGALSYRLHRELADQHDGYAKWGYSPSTGTNLVDASCREQTTRGTDWLNTNGSRAAVAAVHESASKDGAVDSSLPQWLKTNQGDLVEAISEDEGVAQVDPLRLSQFLLQQSIEAGVQLHQPAEALRLNRNDEGGVVSVEVQELEASKSRTIPCTQLLLTAGAWTPKVFSALFPSSAAKPLPITSLAGHSLVIRSPRWNDTASASSESTSRKRPGCHAVFTTLPGGDFSPEIFSRVGSEIYVAGLNDASIPLPDRPENAILDKACITQLREVATKLLGEENATKELGASVDDLEVIREGLCFRPVTPKGIPIITRIEEERFGKGGSGVSKGVFVAAGHGPWGISHSLGTGLVMSELLRDGKTMSANIDALGL